VATSDRLRFCLGSLGLAARAGATIGGQLDILRLTAAVAGAAGADTGAKDVAVLATLQGRGWEASRATRPAGPHSTTCGPGVDGLRPAQLSKVAPRIVRGRPSPGKGAQDPSSSGSAGSFLGLFPCPASRCDPSGRLCGGGVNPPPSRPGDTGPPAPASADGVREAPDEHQHPHQHAYQQHNQHDWRAGQARRTARADQRRGRRAGGLRGVAGDAEHRGEVPQLQRWRSRDIRNP